MTKEESDAFIDALGSLPSRKIYTREWWRWSVTFGGLIVVAVVVGTFASSVLREMADPWQRVMVAVCLPVLARPYGWLTRRFILRSKIERAIDESEWELYRLKMDKAFSFGGGRP